jgi:hypothetical protein
MDSEKTKVEEYIKRQGYTWTYPEIRMEYLRWKDGCYISFTAKKVINACIDSSCQVYT